MQNSAHPEESHPPLQRCDEKKAWGGQRKEVQKEGEALSRTAETPRASGRRCSRSDRAGELVVTFLQIVSAVCMSMCVPAIVVKISPSQVF